MMAARARRGRSLVALALAGFVLIATAVIWRRGYGVSTAADLRLLVRQRDQLRAERANVMRRIADLTGRDRLGSVAERDLGMRVPADSQVIVLPEPAAAPRSAH